MTRSLYRPHVFSTTRHPTCAKARSQGSEGYSDSCNQYADSECGFFYETLGKIYKENWNRQESERTPDTRSTPVSFCNRAQHRSQPSPSVQPKPGHFCG